MTDQPDSNYTTQTGDTFHSLAQLCYHDRNKWMRIRQVNTTLANFGPDQPLPAGFQLTLPFIPELTTTIIIEEGDTLRTLAQVYYQDSQEGNKWMRIRQVNQTLQSYGPDEPFPAGTQLTLPFIPERIIILSTNRGETLRALAQIYYDDEKQSVWFGKANTTLQGIDPDQPLPVGLQLTLPFFEARVIITEIGDTLRTLGQSHFQDEGQWLRIRQINTTLQGFGPDQPLPVGLQLALPPFVVKGVQIGWQYYTTGSGDTFNSLAQRFYGDANKWTIIRGHNPSYQRYNQDSILPSGRQLWVK